MRFGLLGAICHSGTKLDTLVDEAARVGEDTVTLATGDGAKDIPMIAAATYGVAYRAKPVVRARATHAIDFCGLDGVLNLFR